MSNDLEIVQNMILENQTLRYQLERLSFENQYLKQRNSELRVLVNELEGLTQKQREMIMSIGQQLQGSQKTTSQLFQELMYAQGQVQGHRGVAAGGVEYYKQLQAVNDAKPKERPGWVRFLIGNIGERR